MNIWNLLDIVSIFSDNGRCITPIKCLGCIKANIAFVGDVAQCEAGLIFWLIEELLDSQTVDGCRKVFDYLESRREINTAVWTKRDFFLGTCANSITETF